MTDLDFEPPPIPLNSKTLVATLKRRLVEAIETGKASDAKTLVDIIERLAKMEWLDDTTPEQRLNTKRRKRAKIMADVDIRLARFLDVQQEVEDASNVHL